jgi:hypothetical protein
MSIRIHTIVVCVFVAALYSGQALAADLPVIDDPPAPLAPAMVSRDEKGRATLRAVRVATPPRIDGRLDDEIYATIPAVGGFIQQLPREGLAATEPTEVWVMFDDDNVYIAARCIDSQPDRAVANELRRDNRNIFQLNDSLSVVLDTFYDRRNGFFFQTNPLGAVRDQAIKDGGQTESWNTVWDVKATRTARGYTVEMMIPFKSLRYHGTGEQVWGINFRRVVKWKNEVSNLTLVPASYGSAGVSQMATAATLVGLQAPTQGKNLEIKPYAVTSTTTDLSAAVPFSNDVKPAVGLDAKYGITNSLTADLTVNTDFAQVEEDQQQVNLTRFNLQFPEKRDFFIEGQGIFDFGGRASQGSSNDNVPVMFFSRRIGLSGNQAVPVIGGGRVTGKTGHFDIGALVVRTDAKPSASAVATNFSAFRLRREILRRSSVGLIATGRWPAVAGVDANAMAGFDTDLRFFDNVQSNIYVARSASAGRNGNDLSYRGRFAYGGDRYGFEVDRLTVQPNFNPEVGFLRRSNFTSSNMSARFSPRLRRSRLIRRLSWSGEFEYITDAAGHSLEDRSQSAGFGLEFNSSDQIAFSATRHYELLPSRFTISPGVVVPVGSYDSDTFGASYTLAQQRKISGTISASGGTFYDGTRRATSFSGRLGFSPHVAVEPNVSVNWVDLPFGNFITRLAGARLVIAPTARLGFSSFVQYNATAHSLTSSARMRWEYTPGSEVFVVYSDGRDTTAPGYPSLLNRSFAVKVTRLMRF